jgi:hypothetical protein
MPECISCSVEDICDECSKGFYWYEFKSECKAHVECKETEHEAYTADGEQICTLCSESMPECNLCNVNDVCDECTEGYYWWGTMTECKAFVKCTKNEHEAYTEEGE